MTTLRRLTPPILHPVTVEPGKAAWSWSLLKDKKTTLDVQKTFVDYV